MEGTDNLGERAEAGESTTLPDRAEEKRVDVPQNETAAPVEDAQATTDAPTTDANPAAASEPQPTESAVNSEDDQATPDATPQQESSDNS